MTEEAPRIRRPQPEMPDSASGQLVPGLSISRKFLPGEVHPGTLPVRRIAREIRGPEEAGELVENRLLAAEVDAERQAELGRLHGTTEQQLEDEADAFLRLYGFGDLVERKD